MNPTNLWDRAIKRSVFDRSVDGALGAMRQAVRPFGQPRSAPPQSCHGRAAALVVLGLLALALPEAAQAQPVQTLISNFGQPVDSDVPDITSLFTPGQSFTTGPNSEGYGLDSIRVHFPTVNTAPTNLTASIWTTQNSPSLGTTVNTTRDPDAKLFDLINPTDITTPGDKTFTAEANTTLDPLTTYAVVFGPTDGNMEVGITTSRAEGAGGAPDWSIADFRHFGTDLGFNVLWSVVAGPSPLRIEVKGTILVASPDEPRYLRAKTGHAQVVLSWIAPESAGGTPITKYQYRYSAGSTVDTSATWTDVPDGAGDDVPVGADTDIDTETTVTVTGLTNGTRYTFEVRAVNSLGVGATATVSATPRFTLTITWDDRAARSQPSFTVTFTFSEAVEGFDEADWRRHRAFAHAATEENFQMISATTYTIEVTPLAGEELVNIHVSENIVQAVNTPDDTDNKNSRTIAVIDLVPRVTGTSTDATLSALTLEDASDNSAITISPVFAAGTTSYTASVDNDVDEIAITPTVNESNATVEYLDISDTAITDADGVKTGHQVSLDVGANTIKVQVTAADANTPPQTYTVMVTRVADTVPGSANVLVSNAGQSPNSSNNSSGDRAQAFTTVAGATLSSVEIISSDPAGDDLAVSLCTTDSSGYPTSSCTALTAPASFAAGTLVFADPASTTLAANTTYSLLLVSPGDDFLNLSVTPSDAEDTGGAAGWTIANAYDSKSGTVWGTTSSDTSFLITIKGTLGTTTNTAPGAPTGLTATADGPSRIDLAWTAPANTGGTAITGYKIEVSPDGSSSWSNLVADTRSTATTYADTGLNAATTRHYRVSAINAVGTSAASNSDEATTEAAPPPPTRTSPPPQGRRSPPSTPPPPPDDVVGYLENPGAASFQSGIGVISGWTCDAEAVEIVLNGEPQEAAYGTARLDTEAVCGDSDNGFGLLFNWNLLGDGEHEVVALVDGVELDRAAVTVTTLGAEFLRDVTGTCTAADFPTMDETVTLAWQQTQQNFVLVDGPAPAGTTNRTGTPGVGYLENPGPNSFQSGIGVLSGWVCEGTEVIIELNGQPQPAAYGTERLDTLEMCGDTANGFGLLFNWNLLGEGEHEVVAFVDGEELGRATVRVTTLGAEFVLGAEGECVVKDFPMPGETVTLEWQQNSQNFVITDVE